MEMARPFAPAPTAPKTGFPPTNSLSRERLEGDVRRGAFKAPPEETKS
jgi:hypothetical protein